MDNNLSMFQKLSTVLHSNAYPKIYYYILGMLFSRHEKGEDKSDSTIFLGIGGFIVASGLLATVCLLIYKRFRKPSTENIVN